MSVVLTFSPNAADQHSPRTTSGAGSADLADIDQSCPPVDQFWTTSADIDNFGAKSPGLDQTWPGAGQNRPETRPTSADLARNLPSVGRRWPVRGGIWPISTGFGPLSATFGPKMRPTTICPELELARPEFTHRNQSQPKLHTTKSNLHNLRAEAIPNHPRDPHHCSKPASLAETAQCVSGANAGTLPHRHWQCSATHVPTSSTRARCPKKAHGIQVGCLPKRAQVCRGRSCHQAGRKRCDNRPSPGRCGPKSINLAQSFGHEPPPSRAAATRPQVLRGGSQRRSSLVIV